METGDIIQFYNKVFLVTLKNYIINLCTSNLKFTTPIP